MTMTLTQVTTPAIIETSHRAAIRQHQREGGGHLTIRAVAGSGKSQLGRDLVYDLPEGKEVMMLAHNRDIASYNGELVAGRAKSLTFHGAGLKMCGLAFRNRRDNYVNPDKYYIIYHKLLEEVMPENTDRWQWKKPLAQLCEKVRQGLLTVTPLVCQHLAYKYDIEFPEEDWEKVADIVGTGLETGVRQAAGWIDQTDMLFIPWARNLFFRYRNDYIYADEFQDASAGHMDVLRRMAGKNAVITILGDPKQAIYIFMGSDGKAIETMSVELGSRYMPLSVCWRCPKSVLQLARRYVPDIEDAPNAIEGEVRSLPRSKLYRDGLYDPGDMILCRTRRPLIDTYYQLLRSGIPAKVSGKDIGEDLAYLAETIASRKGFRYDCFGSHLRAYKERRLTRMRDNDVPEMDMDAFIDRCDALSAIYDAAERDENDGPVDINGFVRYIEGHFSDRKFEEGVTLSTIHRSKGLQANNVYLLRPDLVPHKKATTPEDMQSELNCIYIWLTRAKRTLTFLED